MKKFDSGKQNLRYQKLGTFLLYATLFFYFVRPQEIIPFIGYLRLSGIFNLGLLIWAFINLRFNSIKSPVRIVLIFGLVMFISALDAVNSIAFRLAFKFTLQYFPMCYAIYILVNTKDKWASFYNFWCWIYFLMALITIHNNGRGPGDFTHDQNDAALALSMGLPFLFYNISLATKNSIKAVRLVMFLVIVVAIIFTGSRGGFLGLASVLIVLWWFSENKFASAVKISLLLIIFSGVFIANLPEGYIDDMQSITDDEDSTRVERLRSWGLSFMMFSDNPILGVGAGNYPWRVSSYQTQTEWWGTARPLDGRQVHSMYFEVLADLGLIGMFIFFKMVFGMPIKLLNRLRHLKSSKSFSECNIIRVQMQTLIASMVAFAISGAFISVAYYPNLYIWVALYAVITRELSKVHRD